MDTGVVGIELDPHLLPGDSSTKSSGDGFFQSGQKLVAAKSQSLGLGKYIAKARFFPIRTSGDPLGCEQPDRTNGAPRHPLLQHQGGKLHEDAENRGSLTGV